jgi:beta-mannosidase
VTNSVDLNGKWNVRQVNGSITIKATVPGVVHNDMLKQGLVEDPLYRDNEIKQQWIGESTWEYTKDFSLTKEKITKESIILDCEGLDTLCTIYVNGTKVALTDNMFIRYRIDIRKFVKVGKNNIKLVFFPANLEIEKRRKKYHLDLSAHVEKPWQSKYRAFLRKTACHRGWDWGPSFMVQGIYRPISVECKNGASILYVTNSQKHTGKKVEISFRAIVESATDCEAVLSFNIDKQNIIKRSQLKKGENFVNCNVAIEKPRLWWPNGFGKQELYSLTVTVETEGETDSHTQRIGLRTVELVTEKDSVGESFFFRVNGVPVFMKGANWIPSDVFDAKLTDKQMEWELMSAKEANHNCVRVWGGGLYERDNFYNMCDEMGLMVWQDLMFACALYPINEQFLESVKEEIRHQVRRLQYHPSIALWCGNNENEEAIRWIGKQDRDLLVTYAAEYDRLFMGTIEPVLAVEDSTRRYWPSSPSNGAGAYGNPSDQTRGDVHYWNVWHGNETFDIYQKVNPRFCSEFGFQSFSSPESMDAVTNATDRNICSSVFEFHQRSGVGNLKILEHICRHFKMPHGYEHMLYVSQVLQDVSIKAGVEHWRRIKPLNMGTIYWQLNDIWPCASWSSLEYDGRWKMLHYSSRKFFAPLLVSSFEKDGNVEIWGTSDINEKLSCSLNIVLNNLNGKAKWKKKIPVNLDAQESKRLSTIKIEDIVTDAEKLTHYLNIRLESGNHSSENSFFFKPFKYLELTNPKIVWSIRELKNGTFEFTLTSKSTALFVWIRTGKTMGIFSDNGILLPFGETRKLHFAPRTPISLASLKRQVIVHDLYQACE